MEYFYCEEKALQGLLEILGDEESCMIDADIRVSGKNDVPTVLAHINGHIILTSILMFDGKWKTGLAKVLLNKFKNSGINFTLH
jgi:hypothetical protein